MEGLKFRGEGQELGAHRSVWGVGCRGAPLLLAELEQMVGDVLHLHLHRGSGFRVQGSGFRVQGPGSRVEGRGLRVEG